MNRASTPSRGLLGSAKHWAKAWKPGIDKVQRDVGDPACGPALQKEGSKVSLGPEKGYSQQSHPAAMALSSSPLLQPRSWPTHHAEQSSFVEGRMESDELGLGS